MKASPDAEAIVWRFYRYLNERDFRAAWDLLDRAYQTRRWRGNFERFRSGYESFAAIVGPQLFLRSSETHFAVFDAFYEERLSQPIIAPLRLIEQMTIGQIRTGLLGLLEDLEADLTRAGGDHDVFEKLQFKRLFHADAAVALPWEMDISTFGVNSVYPDTEVKVLSRGRRLDLTDEAGAWKIRRISWLST